MRKELVLEFEKKRKDLELKISDLEFDREQLLLTVTSLENEVRMLNDLVSKKERTIKAMMKEKQVLEDENERFIILEKRKEEKLTMKQKVELEKIVTFNATPKKERSMSHRKFYPKSD